MDRTVAFEWRPVPGYEGHYEVSEDGQVASVKSGDRRPMSPLRQKSGHLGVSLCLGGVKTRYRIHRLVMHAFVGPCPEGLEVRHLDGDPENNYLANLVYGSGSENRADTYLHGSRATGERSHLAKLSDVQVAEIMALRGVHSSRTVATKFSVDSGYVRSLWRGEARKHDGKESQIEGYLANRAKALGGETRKLKWVGRSSAPDRLVFLPGGRLIFIELKAPGKAATFPANAHERKQAREHRRMRAMGQRVEVVDSFEGVERVLG